MISNVWLSLSCFAIAFIRSEAETYAKKDVSNVYNLYTTQAFFVEISSHIFQKAFDPKDAVEYIPSILGMPDLPNWMHYRHPNSTGKAYLYGSPTLTDDGDIEVEVIAVNQYTYDTTKDIMKFRIIKRERKAKFEVELKIVNYNIDDMFESNRFDDVLQIFKEKLWKDSEDVYITLIASPLDVGGRLPLDPKEKEGVLIRIGSTDNYTRDLLDLEREVDRIKNRNPCPRKYKATSAEYLFRNKGFYSDWCSFQLIRQSFDERLQTTRASKPEILVKLMPKDDLEDNYYLPLRQPSPRRDYVMDIMLCFVVPVLIGTMVISSLVCIFFYSKQQELMKVCNETPVQLEQYNSISRATLKLRSLAQNRNPSLPEFSSATLPRRILKQTNTSTTLPKAIAVSLPVSRAASFRQSLSASESIL